VPVGAQALKTCHEDLVRALDLRDLVLQCRVLAAEHLQLLHLFGTEFDSTSNSICLDAAERLSLGDDDIVQAGGGGWIHG